jgi:hypothetical protein
VERAAAAVKVVGGRGHPLGPPQPRTVAVAPATSYAVGGQALTGGVLAAHLRGEEAWRRRRRVGVEYTALIATA